MSVDIVLDLLDPDSLEHDGEDVGENEADDKQEQQHVDILWIFSKSDFKGDEKRNEKKERKKEKR